ncbi:MAG: CCA tRNA nucleotidyltransferase [Phycisphaerales bacterium]
MTRPASSSVSLRVAAQTVAARLTQGGYLAYFAGGCVRDRLLGIAPEDIDIATDARPEDVRRLFPAARGVGEAFGVMLVRQGGHMFEVATFRSDGDYVDGRRPANVQFASAREDAMRRDFTINGLFEVPSTGEVVDFVGGQADLDARVLRAIGEPSARFAEDHLRLLRAVRFAARFGLAIDPATGRAMHDHAKRLALIARERIGMEVRRMLEEPARVRAVALLEEFALDAIVLGEHSRRSTGRRLGHAPDRLPFVWALAAWGLDREGASPLSSVPAFTCDAYRDALVLSNREEADLRDALEVREALLSWVGLPTHTRRRLAARPGFALARWLVAAEDPQRAAMIDAWLGSLGTAPVAPPRWVNGDDLLALGLTPGPAFRDVLDAIYDAQLDGIVESREDALSLARQMVRSRKA